MTACQIAKRLIDMVFLKSGAKANFKGGRQLRRKKLPCNKLVGLVFDVAPKGIRAFSPQRTTVPMATLSLLMSLTTRSPLHRD
jgi:hypothetical protein